ncbi:single-stranded DNA-binding protein [Leifsonia sp. NPDC058292]|uniref:single-stranded DNA-binding protein n=1 Tax=Leifsonia sp. NPDC058292 TaxID=3346428 RepID=UPI0036D86681
MNDSLSTRGFVATVPNHIRTNEGLPITTFRLATTRRRFNRETKAWENGETNWFTVTAFRQLALNVASSVSKGDPVVVSGRLSVRDWENGDRSGTVVEIDADAVGHDLTWGSSAFSRTIKPAGVGAGVEAAAESVPDAFGDDLPRAEEPSASGELLEEGSA